LAERTTIILIYLNVLKLRCATNQEDDCKFQFVEDMDMEGESGDEIKVKRENYAGNYNSYELMSRQGTVRNLSYFRCVTVVQGWKKYFTFWDRQRAIKNFL
jgi:hypothetical protein